MTRTALTLGLALALLAATDASHAQVPQKMDYQVMLTDAANQPLAGQAVQLVFRIYTLSSGGSQLWTETQNVTTNSIGVVSVVLGSVSPLNITFTAPRWLQVEVNGEVMTPRRELVAAPYARQADNADKLGGTAAASFALSSTLSAVGTINSPGNPVDWTKLKSVPAGFADGTDNAGVGDGNSLDAPDGSPVNAIYVTNDGDIRIGTGTFWPAAQFMIDGLSQERGIVVKVSSTSATTPAFISVCDASSAIVGNANASLESYTVPTTPAGVAGFAALEASGGYFVAQGDGDGVIGSSEGGGSAVHGKAWGTGHSGQFEGGEGVLITTDDGYPVLKVENERTSGISDAAWVLSPSGADGNTWALFSRCYQGRAGTFVKYTDDNEYAVRVSGDTSASEGLYVSGTIYSTAPFATGAATSRGTEAVFGVTAANVEVTDSGKGRLADGEARVAFDRIFAESISGAADLRITATPVGAWSGLYVERIDGEGFTLRSEAGEKNVEFHWAAVGRARAHRERPDVTIPDPAEEARLVAEKEAAAEASRPAARADGPGVITITSGE